MQTLVGEYWALLYDTYSLVGLRRKKTIFTKAEGNQLTFKRKWDLLHGRLSIM